MNTYDFLELKRITDTYPQYQTLKDIVIGVRISDFRNLITPDTTVMLEFNVGFEFKYMGFDCIIIPDKDI